MSFEVKKACILNSCLLASIGINGLQGIGSLEKPKFSLLPEPIKEFWGDYPAGELALNNKGLKQRTASGLPLFVIGIEF